MAFGQEQGRGWGTSIKPGVGHLEDGRSRWGRAAKRFLTAWQDTETVAASPSKYSKDVDHVFQKRQAASCPPCTNVPPEAAKSRLAQADQLGGGAGIANLRHGFLAPSELSTSHGLDLIDDHQFGCRACIQMAAMCAQRGWRGPRHRARPGPAPRAQAEHCSMIPRPDNIVRMRAPVRHQGMPRMQHQCGFTDCPDRRA